MHGITVAPAPREGRGKVSRAHGGCLGAGSRRRTRQAAIVPGEAHTAFDPGVSEWANPAAEARSPRGRTHSPRGGNPGN